MAYQPNMTTKRTLAVSLVGYNFMGKAHSNAWRQAPRFFDLPAALDLKTICGRNEQNVKAAAEKLGWRTHATDWRDVVNDPKLDIIDITTPNDTHAEIAVE